MDELGELVERFIKQGRLKSHAEVQGLLYHEFLHWVIQHNPELWVLLMKLERRII